MCIGLVWSVISICVGMIFCYQNIGDVRGTREQYVRLIILWSTGKNIRGNAGAIFAIRVELSQGGIVNVTLIFVMDASIFEWLIDLCIFFSMHKTKNKGIKPILLSHDDKEHNKLNKKYKHKVHNINMRSKLQINCWIETFYGFSTFPFFIILLHIWINMSFRFLQRSNQRAHLHKSLIDWYRFMRF